jgi:hypothetical protein
MDKVFKRIPDIYIKRQVVVIMMTEIISKADFFDFVQKRANAIANSISLDNIPVNHSERMDREELTALIRYLSIHGVGAKHTAKLEDLFYLLARSDVLHHHLKDLLTHLTSSDEREVRVYLKRECITLQGNIAQLLATVYKDRTSPFADALRQYLEHNAHLIHML